MVSLPVLMILSSCNLTESYILTCTEGDTTRTWCIKEGSLCEVPGSVPACGWNWHHDVNAVDEFTYTNISKGMCLDEYEDGKFPPDPDSSCGDDDGGNGGEVGVSNSAPPTTGGEESGTPTTGADITTGADSTGGDDPECDVPGEVVYLCALNAQTKCADLVPDDGLSNDPYPDDSSLDACWGTVDDPNLPPVQILSPCICSPKDDPGAAADRCGMICDEAMEAIKADMKTHCGEFGPDCYVPMEGEIDCDLDMFDPKPPPHQDVNDYPGELSAHSGYACDGPVQQVAWEYDPVFTLFSANGMFIDPDGLHAAMPNVSGFLSYTLSNCTLLKCDITLTALQGLTDRVQGNYAAFLGDGGTFEIDGMGFQVLGTFSGTWHKLFGKVLFPNDNMNIQLWAGAVSFNDEPVSPNFGVYTVEVDQVVGHLSNKKGPLTLNFSYHSPVGAVHGSLCSQKLE